VRSGALWTSEGEGKCTKRSLTVAAVCRQRSERRKWMLCFDGVDAVIFFVNAAGAPCDPSSDALTCCLLRVALCTGFNRPLFEDNAVTEHQEALSLLETTFGNKIFTDTP
jgi:hypothetical protein